jgi:hypothetical protein
MTPSQAANQIRRGLGPPGLLRIDRPRIPGERWHAHLDVASGGGAINMDGTRKHFGGNLTNLQRDFLRDAGRQV